MTTAVPALDADLVRFEPVFAPAATTEPRWVRALLITIALAFALLFLLIPLAVVFTEALRKGW